MKTKSLFLFILAVFTSAIIFAQNSQSHTVYFQTAKHALSEDAKIELQTIADSLSGKEGFTLQIVGYTDDEGSDDFNMELSEKRALAVKDFFSSKGIQTESAEIRFLGASEFVADNKTEAGRQKNRRAVIMYSFPVKVDDIPKIIATENTDKLYERLRKDYEKFTVNTKRDTILRTEDGVLLVINAGTFDTEDNTEDIEIRLTSFFDIADMLSANLNSVCPKTHNIFISRFLN